MQEQKNNEDTLTDDAIEAGIEELTLALLYLKRFKWNHDDQVARASWRSFDWETLDNLLQSSDLSGCPQGGLDFRRRHQAGAQHSGEVRPFSS